MAQPILTPISLWKDFDDSLEPEVELLSEREKDGVIYRETAISGRQTEKGRVRIYGVEVRPVGEESLPAVLLLNGANRAPDLRLAEYFARRGYCVFGMDYRGETTEGARCTKYPEDIDYANFIRSGRRVLHADEGATKTSWYEWTAAAIYAVKYLKNLPYVTSVGAIGVREGGEIVWKLMTVVSLACGVCINAAGWLAQRGTYKFGEDAAADMAEEQRLFIAGIDSQSYAPFVKCPVLMLVAVTDEFVDADKAYDTYKRINKDQFSTVYYSIGYGGTIDKNGMKDADMFMDKYLKDRGIFIAAPIHISFEENGDDALCAVISSDGQGESVFSEMYFAEDERDAYRREWIKCAEGNTLENGKISFDLPIYKNAETAFVFGRSEYSSGFTVSSRIASKKIEKQYKNSVPHSNILYDSHTNSDVFVPVDYSDDILGGCFKTENGNEPTRAEGYGKIIGTTCAGGLKTYRVAQRRYAPEERAMLHFSVYGEKDCELNVSVTLKAPEGIHERYTTKISFSGGGKWKNFVLPAHNFKSETGTPLENFCNCHTLQFIEANNHVFIINNILWI